MNYIYQKLIVMKKLSILLLYFILFLSCKQNKEKVIFEVHHKHLIEINYWERLNNDTTFKSLYKLVMVKDTVDELLFKDIETKKTFSKFEKGLRPNVDILINLHHKNFYNKSIIKKEDIYN